jgi:hypothetical protein
MCAYFVFFNVEAYFLSRSSSGAGEVPQDLDGAEQAPCHARAIVDLLQGAAAHRDIVPPSNHESLAQTLGVVIDLP